MAKKSLGTLTLDLVANTGSFVKGLDKSERATEKWKRKVKSEIAAASKAVAALGAASVAGLAAMTTNLASSAREIENLSRVANASTSDFQKIAFAAQRYGIEQEKVSDILKDTNDRIGDFLQTGGGPMADFFEKIAPLVGVTADEFARLSGPDALQLYVSSLEKAGASQQEMTFYMEALAGDATLLLPLLQDNGKELALLGDEAERTGNVLSAMDFSQLREMAKSTDELHAAFSGMTKQVALAAIPAINELTDLLGDPDTISNAQALGGAIVSSVSAATNAVLKTVEVVQFLSEELASIGAGAAYDDIVRLEEQLEKTKSALANPTERLRFFGPGGVIEYWDEGELNAEITRLENAIETRRKELALDFSSRSIPSAKVPSPPEEDVQAWENYSNAVKGAEDTLKSIDVSAVKIDNSEVLEAQNRAIEAYASLVSELRTDEEKLNDTLTERLDILKAVGKVNSETASRVAADAFESAPQYAGLAPEVGGAGGELFKVEEAQKELEDWYATQLDMLAEYRKTKSELNAQWDEQEIALNKEHQEKLAQIDAARIQASYAVSEEIFSSLAGLTREFAGEQSTAYKVMFAAEKAAGIARSLVAIQTGIAQAAANPWPVNLEAMASVAAATSGIVGKISSVTIGQAHDGWMSVPKTGTYLLEKGERVTTEKTSAKLDKTLSDVQSNVGSGGGGGQASIRINNLFDEKEVFGGYLGSKAAEKQIMNIVSKNRRTVQSLVV